jgi:hypothetical protein
MVEMSRGMLNSRRRSYLKEDASDLRQREVMAKIQEKEREIGTKQILLTRVGATNFRRPYKLDIYTPKLGLRPLRLIKNMARPLIDSVNTVIRCPYSPNTRTPSYLSSIWWSGNLQSDDDGNALTSD